jgi:hypothetical protein
MEVSFNPLSNAGGEGQGEGEFKALYGKVIDGVIPL